MLKDKILYGAILRQAGYSKVKISGITQKSALSGMFLTGQFEQYGKSVERPRVEIDSFGTSLRINGTEYQVRFKDDGTFSIFEGRSVH